MSSRFGATMGGADKLKPLPEQDEELPVDEPLPAVELGEMDEQPEDAGLDRRLVRCDRPGDNKLIKLCVDNRLSSRKYPSWLLFVPMNLFEQFCRVANIYQLCIAVLYMIPIISPASNGYPNIGGLAAMVGATMAKDGYEDARRASSDAETNSRPCVVYSEESGQWEERNWGSLWPGTLIQVHENEQVPADMMILGSLKFNHEDPEAFLNDNGAVNVSTKGLDGETTLKARQAGVQDLRKAFWREPHVGTLQKHVRYVDIPAPNGDIDNLEGEAVLNDGRKVHIYRSGFMLRGTVVEQTHKVWGMVLYTGEQSKLVMNNRMTIARKVTQVEHRMNLIVMWVFAVTVCVCITLSVAMAFWSNIDGPGHWYLQLQYNPTELFTELEIGYFNPDSPALVAIIGFGTWMILQSVMIPLVLPLTIDGIKLLVGNWVAWDLGMYDEDMDQSAQVKNSSVIEDLGQVQYVVSDKTGTLTQNKMALLKLSTGGPEMYGEGMTEVDLEIKKQENPNMSPPASPRLFESSQTQMRDFLFYDRRISDYAWLKSENNGKLTETERQHAEDLLLAMSLCHEVVPLHDESSEHKIVYSAQSPDDSALVLAARHLGFEFAALESNDKGKEFKVNIACGRSEQTSQDVVAGLPVEPAMELSRHVTKVIQRQQTLVPSHPMQFQQHSFQVLYSLKFTSHLKRAGVVVRMPDGSLKVFLKGADSVIIEMLEKSGDTSERLKHTMDHVTSMAASGLRTMMYASREMSQEEFDNWAPKWEMILQAEKSGKMPQTLKAPDAGSFTPRTLAVSPRKYSSMSPKEQIEAQMQALRDQAEVGLAHGGGLHVLGAVGIEDRLQENVGHVLATLADSGVHTWMCTGDKVETAVMIGHACQLLRPWPKMDLVYLGPVKMDQTSMVGVLIGGQTVWPFTDPDPDATVLDPAGMSDAQRLVARHMCQLQAITDYYATGRKMCPIRKQIVSDTRWYRQCTSADGLNRATSAGEAAEDEEFSWLTDICQESFNQLDSRAQDRYVAFSPVDMMEHKRLGLVVPAAALKQMGFGCITETELFQIEAAEQARDGLKAKVCGDPTPHNISDDLLAMRKCQLQFIQLAKDFKSVVACRLQPVQKKEITHLLKTELGQITLSIGDGANDVSMIKEAHVGIGIAGLEGTQAVNNSDFAITQFQYLLRLMLVHGRWLYYRLALIINYFFYKSIIYGYTLVFQSFTAGFSGVLFYDNMVATLYNIIFSSFGVLVIGFFEQDVSAENSLVNPSLYKKGHTNELFDYTTLGIWCLDGAWAAAMIYVCSYFYMANAVSNDGKSLGMIDLGWICMTSLIVIVTFRLAIDTLHFTKYHHWAYWAVIALWFVFAYAYTALPASILNNVDGNADGYMGMYIVSAVTRFWFNVPITIVVCMLPKFTYKSYLTVFRPGLVEAIRTPGSQRRDSLFENVQLESWLTKEGSQVKRAVADPENEYQDVANAQDIVLGRTELGAKSSENDFRYDWNQAKPGFAKQAGPWFRGKQVPSMGPRENVVIQRNQLAQKPDDAAPTSGPRGSKEATFML